MKKKVGICFSRGLAGKNPLEHTGKKLPVYIRFLEFCQKKGWGVYVLTRRTYTRNGVFNGCWYFDKGDFLIVDRPTKIDLVYDRVGGVKFPPEGDKTTKFVNERRFKIFCWDKWLAYQKIGKYMPKTFWVGRKNNLASALLKIKTEWVVFKPYNGLKGLGVFIGPKKKARKFEFLREYPEYIAQEFIDTSGGIPKVTRGLHDLRIVIVNKKPVWCHVRVPPKGSYKANVARGGNISEVDYQWVPKSVKKIVDSISRSFCKEYDNPIFGLDFGINKERKPFIFEINDQIGFPLWEMKNRDVFLEGLVGNFEKKLAGN